MSQHLTFFWTLATALLVGVQSLGEDEAGNQLAREANVAVERALDPIQESTRFWTETAACMSCHHQGMGALAVALARETGFRIDEKLADSEATAVRNYSRERYEPLLHCTGVGVFGRSMTLLGLGARNEPRDDVSDVVAYFIASRQTVTGEWYSNEHRPPFEDTHISASAFCVRALQLYGPEGRKEEMTGRLNHARGWLEAAAPKDMEERSMRLLGMAWCGSEEPLLQAAAKEIVGWQRADGGWAQIETRASDAYATGQALVVLNQAAGLSTESTTWKRGLRFLLDTQAEDGTWHVRSRRRIVGQIPKVSTGFPYQRDQFISYFGSTWSMMALALHGHGSERTEALFGIGPGRDSSDTSACDLGVSALHLAAAFGTLAELRSLLESGADPNIRSSTGLTPLMLAAHDLNKIELLLKSGGNPHELSDEGYTPLLAACLTSGAGAVVTRLIEERVSIDSLGLNGASPLFCAANLGDCKQLRELAAAGAQFPLNYEQFALIYAATCNDVKVARVLLDLGADVNAPVGRTPTPLASAVISGYVEFAEFLIERGANVDTPDSSGMTPLAWAAKMDPLDTRMVELLIESGASLELESEDGLTAMRWAKRFGNKEVVELLRAAGASSE